MLAVATLGFGLNFWAWGLLGPLSPHLREQHGLSPAAHGVLIGVPLVLGSVLRLPAGVLADRHGARVMLPAVSLLAAVPVAVLGVVDTLPLLVAAGCAAGIGGAAFSVGAALVTNWYPYGRRGLALGLFGVGAGGAAIGNFAAGHWFGLNSHRGTALVLSGLLIGYAGLAALLIRDTPPVRSEESVPRAALNVVRTAAGSSLSILYAITFGGLVALVLYLPIYLHLGYAQSWRTAILWTAAVGGLAAVLRAAGGWLADHGAAVTALVGSYVLVAFCLGVLAFQPRLVPVAGLAIAGVAVGEGVASGALLALICKAAPAGRVGAFAGTVGAAGGLGGMVPPLLLAGIYRIEHAYSLGPAALAVMMLGVAAYVRTHGAGVALGMVYPQRPAPSPTALSLVVVSGSDTDYGAPAVVATIAELATRDEVVVVCGQAERKSRRMSPHALLAGLRNRLPRHQIMAVLVDTQVPAFARDCALLRSLLEVGAVPVAVTSTTDPGWQAVELAQQLQVDRMLYVTYHRPQGVSLNQVWTREPADALAG